MKCIKYKFNLNIKKSEYDNFIEKNSKVSFMQEYNWANIKNEWKSYHAGLYKGKELVAVALILERKFPLGYNMWYIPRGFVTDFNNAEVINTFTIFIKKEAKSKKVFNVKIDPNFCIDEYYSNKKKSEIRNYSNEFKKYNENLLSSGFKRKKLVKNINYYQQPRFNMVIPLIDKDNNILSGDQVKKTYKKNQRYYIGNYHEKRGVSFAKSNKISDLDTFVKILHETEIRQNIILRNKEYFKNILENFNCHLFFGKLDLNKYLEFCITKNDEPEIKKIKELIKDNDILTLTSALVIIPKNKTGIRMSEYLYAGNDITFPRLQINDGVIHEICKYSIEEDCHYVNLGGVDGNLNDNLTNYKSKYNAIVLEYAGEYDLIINPIIYQLVDKLLPLVKKVYKKVAKLKRK